MTIEYIDRMPSMTEYAEGKRINPKMTDLISRADAIEVWDKLSKRGRTEFDQVLMTLPSAENSNAKTQNSNQKSNGDFINRADAIEAVHEYYQKRFTEDSKWDADAKMLVLEDKTIAKDNMEICNIIKKLPSADAEPKWNCTANFVAEQLDRLRNMTDEERWEFFKRFFEMKGGDTE